MKKVDTSLFLSRFATGVFTAAVMVLANDLDFSNLLQYRNPKDAAINAFSGNSFNSINKENATNSGNSIDPDRYYVGGGDEFIISVVGLPSINYKFELNQQGDMYIPELGLLTIGKITLTEARQKIAAYIREKLKKQNEIYVELAKVKNVTITVNGAVENPGTYILSGGNRILDAIRLANKESIPSINENNFREVVCKNKNDEKTIDLFEYLLKNDITGNPYLYPGDHISLLQTTKKVYLNALTKSGISGWVPIKEEETLAGFLSFHRFDFSVDTSSIYFQSIGENNDRSIKTIAWQDAGSVMLHDKDIITIPEKKNYSPVYLVSISGEVARPGTYSILRDSTTAQDILAAAGGPTHLASMDRAVIIRSYKVEQREKNKAANAIEKAQETKGIRPEMVAGLEKMLMTADFSIIDLNRFGMTIRLEENDHIVLPEKEKVVYLSGNIKRPGAYEYREGENKYYYIKKAGGYTGKASKSNVFGMRYYEKACIQTDLSEILEGDIIIVPESQQGKTISTIIFPVISIVLSTIGTIVTIITISASN